MSKALDIEGLDTIEAVLPDFASTQPLASHDPELLRGREAARHLPDRSWHAAEPSEHRSRTCRSIH